jgi:creatinine amidohydrolase
VPRAVTFRRLKELALALMMSLFLAGKVSLAQNTLPVGWEALTTQDFVKAIHKAQNTCLLPFGIMESHAYHLPIGTDLYIARYVAVHAAQRDYAVVFHRTTLGKPLNLWTGREMFSTAPISR